MEENLSSIAFFPLQTHDEEEVNSDRRIEFERTSFLEESTGIGYFQILGMKSLFRKLKNFLTPDTKIGRQARKIAKKLPKKIQSELFQIDKRITRQESAGFIPRSADLGYGILTSINPLVTVIIPVFNNWQVTERCLKAIRLCQDSVPFEIIVVDDFSSDETSFELKKLRGIHVLSNLANCGYLMSNNLAAKYSHGKYLMLLNNDTEPITGWLDHSVKVMEQQPTVAIVGSKLLYPNGNVQEAGGQVFSNGNAWNLGRTAQDKFSAEVCSVREVDYCSAAALLVRREFWDSTGGFDERYRPAYYEDTDLCMRAWELGLRVMYQPESVVVHYEGLSNGKSIGGGIKRYQSINKLKFFEKWAHALTSHWEDAGVARLEHLRASKGIIVLIDAQLPSKFRDSGSQRTLKLIENMQELGFHVVLGALDNSTSRFDILELQKKGVEVHFDLDYLISSLKLRKIRLTKFWIIRSNVIAAVLPTVEKYFAEVGVVTDLLDLDYTLDNINNVVRIDTYQLSIVKKSKVTVLVSPFEASLLREKTPGSYLVDLWTEFENRNPVEWTNSSGVVFLGGFRHKPNVEALEWFIDSVLPELRKSGFQQEIRIVGTGLSKGLQKKLQEHSIKYLGFQENLDAVYHASRVCISPLQFGRGLKGKIGEALSYGIPIVGTELSFEGFNLHDKVEVMIENDPKSFAAAIMKVHDDRTLWGNLSLNSREYWARNLAPGTLRERISQLLTS